MVKTTEGTHWTMEEVTCSCETRGIFKNDSFQFKLTRWSEELEATLFGGEKIIRLSLTNNQTVSLDVAYYVKNEEVKDIVYNRLIKFLESVDGKRVNVFDYDNQDIDKTKFPVIRGVRREWEN